MSFQSNPLSLSLPDSAFESWLRDSGYLEVLDHRSSSSASSASSAPTACDGLGAVVCGAGFFSSVFSHLGVVISLLTLNPFAKLTTGDFSGDTPYQIPFALVGLLSSLALWDFFKFSDDKWGLDQRPILRLCLIRTAQCATAVILICCNVQMALFCSFVISYAALLLHAAFRKLTPANQVHKKRK
ncbi:hypothetical protein SAY87_005113 [Trapa incisa]|uniref:PRA1 family protein n=1 Tax=Trapa incisa TaxID=236973 RepID=A0AAN7JQS8_9MYRT|nr:hypothetical protein SAY87_005113 [Trapa incisa]